MTSIGQLARDRIDVIPAEAFTSAESAEFEDETDTRDLISRALE